MTTILPGRVVAAASYLAGLDQDSKLTASSAAAYVAAGYRFCLRYLSLGAERSADLSYAEADLILGAGLALMPVQHVDAYGWSPTAALGASHGQSAAADATTVGFPPDVCVWLDLEGVAAGTPPGDVVDYCQAWYTAVAGAGYTPGIYVGPNSGISSSALSDLSFAHYWSSASSHLPVPARGFQMFQGLVEGHYDPDYVVVDGRGGQAQWLALAPPGYPTLRAGNTSASDAVKCLQRALVAGGFGALSIDGLFGAATKDAVMAAQRSAGLTVDGVAGVATWPAVVAAATAKPAS